MPVKQDDIVSLWRLLIGMDPNAAQIQRLQDQCGDVGELRQRIISSQEFRRYVLGSTIPLCKPLDWPHMEIEVDVSQDQLQRMTDRVERAFNYLGETEPHWSVLSSDRFRSTKIRETDEAFFASGTYDVNLLRHVAERCDVDLSNLKTCFELGCGLGRTTRWLADQFDRVIGADISRSHLRLAEQTMTRFGKRNVTLIHINRIAELEAGPDFDLFLSVIVLQHNPPPLIAHLLRTVLRKLNPGGVAYFQVPTYRLGYRFDADLYLSSELKLGNPEMHILPQHVVLEIAHQAGCRPLEIREDPSGAFEMISNRFFCGRSLEPRMGAYR